MESGKPSNFEASDDENDQPEKFSDGKSGVGRSYDCTFCKRGFTNAQALGGHMNIHRKDKAKAKQNSKESSFTSKSNEAYNSRYFSTTSSEQPHYYGGVGAHFNYQNYFPPSNPSNQHAYHPYNPQAPRPEQPGLYEDHGDATLSLNIGIPHVEFGEGRNENEDDNEVDLELRLGHHR